ncbi:Rad52/Rad22 family DNA repair protein [Deinococcus kurensis]|uniref:Rad52/Rad22 family DNA repair protein n=1 Tax=Deinococcus kurensis TaxID=2662757 RepID=UPI0012D2CE51|nr:Rad52/Rad22 family DNA repair protein [Deinococcus kurensis]
MTATNMTLSAPVDHHTAFSAEQHKMLDAKLSKDLVAERQGLSYLEAHVAIRHANQIFGYGNWQRNEPKFTVVHDTTDTSGGKPKYSCGYLCTLSITVYGFVNGQRVPVATTYGTGFGDGTNMPDKGKCHEFATKEAESDAMKRALIAFGDQFGLALYDKQQRYVGDDDNAPDTYGEKNAVVTTADIKADLNKFIGAKKALAVKHVTDFNASQGAAKLDDLNPEQLRQLQKELKQFR